jgi:hypothetical protein
LTKSDITVGENVLIVQYMQQASAVIMAVLVTKLHAARRAANGRVPFAEH